VFYPIEINWNVIAPTYVGGYGRYRLEVESETGQATDYFLNIYRPTIDGVNNYIPSYTKFEDDEFFGVVFNVDGEEYKAKFPKNGDAPFVGDAPPNIPIASPAVLVLNLLIQNLSSSGASSVVGSLVCLALLLLV
jgi:hypothetical protein